MDFLRLATTIDRSEWISNPDRLAMELDRHGIDILFSTEGSGPSPDRPMFLDGDYLSAATGTIVASNSGLLPATVPAGIPFRGVDFGLDAANLDPAFNLERGIFSTEILWRENTSFSDGDVLGAGNGVADPHHNLIDCLSTDRYPVK